jgi:hypothetical protein
MLLCCQNRNLLESKRLENSKLIREIADREEEKLKKLIYDELINKYSKNIEKVTSKCVE